MCQFHFHAFYNFDDIPFQPAKKKKNQCNIS